MSLLSSLTGVLGAPRVEQLRAALASWPKEELEALTNELRAAHQAAQTEETRRQVLDRLLDRLARRFGIELSILERTLLRTVVGRLVAQRMNGV